MMKTKYLLLPLLASSSLLSHMALANNHWPDLPIGVKNGVSAQIGSKVYVGLGSAEKSFYVLDTQAPQNGWTLLAEFIGPERSGATATVVGENIFVFGGSGKASDDASSPIIFDTVYRFDTQTNRWHQVKTQTPVGLLGASSYSPDGKQVLFFGGYSKPLFDKYLADITRTDKKAQPEQWQKIVDDYMGMEPLAYQWNRDVLSFNPTNDKWDVVTRSPYLPNCGSATVIYGPSITLISGEIKPGLRTAEVKTFTYGELQPWQSTYALPAAKGQAQQEGIAGAYSGVVSNTLLVAGGANFHGAKAQFESGQMFAHNGLSKAYNSEIYAKQKGVWQQVGQLPEGLAYGASFSVKGGVLMVGGERADRTASSKVYLVGLNNNQIDIVD
ncbi:TPA: YjhT family mutarotase [Vibrio vulnificus]|nr:YjhT family mutarotase [Vibrio vulnificus]